MNMFCDCGNPEAHRGGHIAKPVTDTPLDLDADAELLRRWGGPCIACGHPSSYHGVTFCQVRAGADRKRDCDCTGYASPHAHDSGLRERLEMAVEHRRTGPGRCACGYDAYKVGGFFPDYHAMLTNHLNAAARTVRGTT